jgi:polar amino acid transport system substrate-binding protein
MGGCQKANISTSESSLIEEIKRRGEIRVGYLVWDPCVIKDLETAKLSGIYPDMVTEIAKALGVKVVWVETTLANFAAGLQAKQFDFSVGPTFITIPRALAVSFTHPIAYVGNSAVVKTDNNLRPESMAELNRNKIRIAVLQGQALEEYTRRNVPNAEILVLSGSDLTGPLLAVTAGKADIGFMNSVTVAKYTETHPEVTAVFTGPSQIEILPLAWAVRKDDTEMLAFLNAAITYFKSTRRLDEYQRKYAIQLLYDTPQLRELR